MKTNYTRETKYFFILFFLWIQVSVEAQSIINNHNVALNKPASASSSQSAGYNAAQAFDGNFNTRFSSGYSDTEWVAVDLGQYYLVDTITLAWEKDYGKDFNILFSRNGTFTDMYNDSLQIRNNSFSGYGVSVSGNGVAGTNNIIAKTNTIARYVKMKGVRRATANGYSLFEFQVAASSSSTGALPVTLTGFNATAQTNSTLLDWQTTTEFNNAGFSVEHSTDGTNFTAIGFVTGINGGTVVSHYSFTDRQPVVGKNYYRLKIIDENGKGAYSASTSSNNIVLNGIKTYPVPVKDHFVIEYNGTNGENINIALYNPDGQPVYSSKITAQGGDQKITINRTSNMLPGIYFVSFGSGNDKHSAQIVLQ
jgi:F5/8 type C domain/Secretion system C-terminal sorting domain